MIAQCIGCGRYFTTHGVRLHMRKCRAYKQLYWRITHHQSLLDPRQLHAMHMGVEKAHLLRTVLPREDWRAFFDLPDAMVSREEQRASMMKDPRTVFCSCECKKNPDGSCSGEPKEVTT